MEEDHHCLGLKLRTVVNVLLVSNDNGQMLAFPYVHVSNNITERMSLAGKGIHMIIWGGGIFTLGETNHVSI